MTPSEQVRDLCAKLASASEPEFERVCRELRSAVDQYTQTRIAECVHELYAEKNADKRLGLVEELKEMLDDQNRSSSAKAS